MKIKNRYVVMGLEKTHEVQVGSFRNDLPLIWADRMCGVMPVFETKKAALVYAGKKHGVMKVRIEAAR